MRKIESVLIVGYGVMGQGVSKTFADAGFKTTVKSSRAMALEGVPLGVTVTSDFPRETPDLIIEFVPEAVPTKQTVYAEIEAAYPDGDYLIASGTSGLDLIELAAKLEHPERFIGLHYFMPADKTQIGRASCRDRVYSSV